MPSPQPSPPPPEPLRRADALAAGTTDAEIRRALRAGQLERIARGVYIRAADAAGLDAVSEHRIRARAVGAGLPEGTVVSHVSAAVLHGLELLRPDLSRVHVTRDRRSGGRRDAGRHLHVAPLRAEHCTVVDGVACTTIARTVVDMACTMSVDDAVVAGDSALAADAHLADDIVSVIDTTGRRRGIAAARRIVDFLDGRSESAGESLSRVRMRACGMPPPTLQKVIRTPGGLFVARTDFFWEDGAVIGEFDGMTKYDDRGIEAVRREKFREDALRDLGYQVLRWTWADLSRFDRVRERFERARARGSRYDSGHPLPVHP